MAEQIDLADGGAVTANNVTKLHGAYGELPSQSVISQVDGNRSDEAAENFTTRLQWRSEVIADRVAAIREFVSANAEALSNAVDALRETDRLSSTAADQTTALIDDVAAGKTLTGAAAGATTGAAGSPSTSSTGGADGAKQIFGG